MLPVIQTVVEWLTREAIKAADLNAALGEVVSGGSENVPFTLKPHDPALKEIVVVCAPNTDHVSHVELLPTQPIPMHTLIAAFGNPHAVPLQPRMNAQPQVAFYAEPPGRSHTAAIFATYSPELSEVQRSHITTITIRRD